MKQVLSSFPEILNHVIEMYSGFGPLVFLQDNVPVLLSSQDGIHQGIPLAIHDILTTLQSKFPNIVVLAYMNDVFLIGPSAGVLDAFTSLKEEFGDVGLQIQEKKCDLYSSLPSAIPYSPLGSIPITYDETKILGVPICSHSFASNVCLDIVKNGNELCQQFPDLNESHAGSYASTETLSYNSTQPSGSWSLP